MHEIYLRNISPNKHLLTNAHADALLSTKSSINKRSSLVWGEHCSECAIPSCFSTCEYYSPRADLKCQRFVGGIIPASSQSQGNTQSISVTLKKWGKLEATGVASFITPSRQLILNQVKEKVEGSLNILPIPYFLKIAITNRLQRALKKFSTFGTDLKNTADGTFFLIETINNSSEKQSYSFTVREADNPTRFIQKLIECPPGHHRNYLSIDEFQDVSIENNCLYQIESADSEKNPSIIFGVIDFVEMNKSSLPLKSVQKVKAVVWDLDNTVWDGTLVEDGVDNVKLRREVVNTIKRLDEMGILNSVASKNNYDDALNALKKFEIDHYFLYPQVSWNPKSNSLKMIQKSLNIGIDTIIFIDDQVFERSEVSTMLPEVKTYSDSEATTLLDRPEFQIPITEESRKRRKMYQENVIRMQAMETASDDYLSFLENCKIEMQLESLSEKSMERVHELSQRTNQMNFSGNRYTKTQLLELMKENTKNTFVISCKDKFGEYGFVGFAIVDNSKKQLNDLMFSCRIQAKQVEHTFIKYLLKSYKDEGEAEFLALYKPTEKNAQSGQVFSDIGFSVANETQGLQELHFDLATHQDEKPIITVIDKTTDSTKSSI